MDTHPWLFPRPLVEIEDTVVSNHVFLVHCSNRSLSFAQHLAVLAAWRLLEPDKMEIHIQDPILTDKYNTWLHDLVDTIPVLHIQVIG